jgi:hypothetical protein
MALIALTVSDTVEFISDRDPAKQKQPKLIDPSDPPKGQIIQDVVGEDATRFYLSPLDVFLMGHIYDSASILSGKSGSDEVGIHTRVNHTNIEAVRHGLKGFKNFDGKDGPVRFRTQKAIVNGREYEVVADAVMNRLGIQLIQELATKIKAISEVTADEEKNSAPGSQPSA